MNPPLEFRGGWYVDATFDEYCVLMPQYIDTHRGRIDCPQNDEPIWLAIGPQKFAGQAHWTNRTLEYIHGDDWHAHEAACGVWPVIYDQAGALHISDCSIGSQGWRYVAPDGRLVTGDETVVVRDGLNEWTDLSLAQDGSIRVGQGHDSGGVVVLIDGVHRLLHPGACFAIRAKSDGTRVVICFYDVVAGHTTAYIYRGTVAELSALPILPEPEPEPDPMSLEAPNRKAVVAKYIALHPDWAKDETLRGKIIDLACAEANAQDNRQWGRKSRNPQGTDLNTDGMCWKRADGKHEIYDAITGSGGSSWDAYGPFAPGENGYWVPAGEVTPPPPPPNGDDLTLAELSTAVALIQGRLDDQQEQINGISRDVFALNGLRQDIDELRAQVKELQNKPSGGGDVTHGSPVEVTGSVGLGDVWANRKVTWTGKIK